MYQIGGIGRTVKGFRQPLKPTGNVPRTRTGTRPAHTPESAIEDALAVLLGSQQNWGLHLQLFKAI